MVEICKLLVNLLLRLKCLFTHYLQLIVNFWSLGNRLEIGNLLCPHPKFDQSVKDIFQTIIFLI